MTLARTMMVHAIASAVDTIWRDTPREEWDSIKDRRDPRVEGRFLVRCYSHAVIDLVAGWLHQHTYGVFRRWHTAECLPMKTVEDAAA